MRLARQDGIGPAYFADGVALGFVTSIDEVFQEERMEDKR